MSNEIIECRNCGAKNRVKPHTKGRAVCGKCKTPLPDGASGPPMALSDANFSSVVNSGLVLVDFWADWCGPCKMMGPILDQLSRKQSKIQVAKLDTEKYRSIAGQYGISSIPTLILFQKGTEIKRISGAMPLHSLENELRPWL